ncbi:NapC/NirT family cytochrome c [Candidatus Poribacteria bacterium]
MPIAFLSKLGTRIRKMSLKAKLLLLASIIVVVVLFSIISLEVTGTNIFCSSCHEMREHVSTWKSTAHSGVQCKKCHIPAGGISMMKRKIVALKEVYFHITADKDFEEIRAESADRVPDKRCKKCHEDTQNLIVYHSLKITHKDHWERGISCTECHARVVHGPRAKNTPSMETCRKCHDGKTAPDECGLCHVTLGERKPSAFDPQWVEAHKLDIQQNEDTCQKCHGQSFCNNCHTSAKPHAGDWFGKHSEEAQKDIGSCGVCHKERYCTDCHEIRKEHSLDWTNVHGDEAKTDRTDCDRCHKESFCADCHTKFVKHPDDWLENHGPKVEDDPESCETCHTDDFCMTCHE